MTLNLCLCGGQRLFSAVGPRCQQHYTSLAESQWAWVEKNLYIDGIIQGDSLTGSTCSNDHAFLTYIEGVGISANIALFRATNNNAYVTNAKTIGASVLSGKFGMIENGILIDNCNSDLSCDADEAQLHLHSRIEETVLCGAWDDQLYYSCVRPGQDQLDLEPLKRCEKPAWSKMGGSFQ